jgi:hypothetical protein
MITGTIEVYCDDRSQEGRRWVVAGGGRDARSPAQRLVLFATECCCARPGCDVPAYWCQVRHVTDWARDAS